ncbi:hypothetical protein [Flavobacterium sp. H122]|uniref:hypothetical protein n=1 Tax=Flavobacterium sp. H122 TaxID=2529860 RepID=UPI0010AB4A86|nr:hypothetical protein [Flavobacterium sp. H122]
MNFAYLIIILLMFFISCKNESKNIVSLKNRIEIKENGKNNSSTYKFIEVKIGRKDFIEQGEKYSNEYKVDNLNIKIADNLDVKNNYNLKQVYINNKLIFSTKSETWIFKPYYCKNSKNKILFFEEGDESGTWGYNIFLLNDNNVKEVVFLEISSLNNSELNKYVSLFGHNNLIQFKFLEDEIFLETENNVIKTKDADIKIDTNTFKILINNKKGKPTQY